MRTRERAKMAALNKPTTVQATPTAVCRQTNNTPSVQLTTSAVKTRRRLERKRRTNRMLIAMVLIFVVCWLPLNVVHVTFETMEAELDETTPLSGHPYHNQQQATVNVTGTAATPLLSQRRVRLSREYIYNRQRILMRQQKQQQDDQSAFYLTVFFIVHLIAMSSAVYNPFLYAWLNENFKGHFARVVPCLFRCPTRPSCWLRRAGSSAHHNYCEPPTNGEKTRVGGAGAGNVGGATTSCSASKYATVMHGDGDVDNLATSQQPRAGAGVDAVGVMTPPTPAHVGGTATPTATSSSEDDEDEAVLTSGRGGEGGEKKSSNETANFKRRQYSLTIKLSSFKRKQPQQHSPPVLTTPTPGGGASGHN